jgi:two-component system LytT family response regulator
MNIRALIIDDEQKGIDTLRQLIEKYLIGVKVVAETTQPLKGVELIESYRPEVVFLDISMPGMNGFELLEKLEWKNFNLIFTTAYREYALRAIKIDAIDYLLKPVDHKELKQAVDRIKAKTEAADKITESFNYIQLLSSLEHNSIKTKLPLNLKMGIEYIDVSEIVSLESVSNYTRISFDNEKKILSSRTLKEFDLQLCLNNVNFMRVHNSFIINLKKVIRYTKENDIILMSDRQQIPVSRSRKELFQNWLSL